MVAHRARRPGDYPITHELLHSDGDGVAGDAVRVLEASDASFQAWERSVGTAWGKMCSPAPKWVYIFNDGRPKRKSRFKDSDGPKN
jgi:hypothetical protein